MSPKTPGTQTRLSRLFAFDQTALRNAEREEKERVWTGPRHTAVTFLRRDGHDGARDEMDATPEVWGRRRTGSRCQRLSDRLLLGQWGSVRRIGAVPAPQQLVRSGRDGSARVARISNTLAL